METVCTVYEVISGNRHLTITKGKNSVDIRIAYAEKGIIEEELNIPITMDAYYSLVNEMAKGCQIK